MASLIVVYALYRLLLRNKCQRVVIEIRALKLSLRICDNSVLYCTVLRRLATSQAVQPRRAAPAGAVKSRVVAVDSTKLSLVRGAILVLILF